MSRRTLVVSFPTGNNIETNKTFEEVSAEYFTQLRRQKKADDYLKHERENLRAIRILLPSDMVISEISTEFLESTVFDVMRSKQNKAITINHRLKTSRRLFEFARERGYINNNPANAVVKMKETQTEIPSLSKEQVVRLLEQPDVRRFAGLRDRTLMQLMLDTGIRLREALDIEVEHIDFNGRRIRNVKGKNGRIEELPISRVMAKELANFMHVRGELPTKRIFVTVDGNPISRRTFQERLKEYGVSAGITNVRVSPHTLRHTFAKQWILNQGDVFSLQRILRHSTMDMVRRYVFLWSNEIQEQHDRFSPLLSLSENES